MSEPVKLYYWYGKGLIGSLIRDTCDSIYDHVAVSVTLDGLPCYYESYYDSGFRVVPMVGDDKPDGFQDTGLVWTPGKQAEVMLALSRRKYSYWNGILTPFGINRHSKRIECAQSASIILSILGLKVDTSNPGEVANQVFKLTGNPAMPYVEGA